MFAPLRSRLKRLRQGPSTQDLTKRMVLNVVKKRTVPSAAQWRHLPRTLTPVETWVVRVATSLTILSLIFLGGRYVLTHQTLVPAVGGTYTEGLIGEPQFVNPLYAITSDVDTDITRLVFSGLLKYDPALGLVPDLAESYDVSDDGLVYTFVLREGAKWHDGADVRVRDILSTINMIQNPEYKSPLIASFRDVDAIQVDERTVQFVLPEPFAPFLSALTVGILPGDIWENIPPKNATLADANLQPIGSGPYQFEKFTKDALGSIRSYTLVRSRVYYGEQARIERITFKFYPDTFSALDALDNKNVEGVSFVPADAVKDVASDRSVNLLRPLLPQYTGVFFNEIHQPILADVDVRKALAMALPRDRFVNEVLDGHGRVVYSPFLPGMVGYSDQMTGPAFDLDGARAILETEGWKAIEGQNTRGKTGSDGTVQPLKIVLTTFDHPEFVKAAEIIKDQWGFIGVETEIQYVDADTMQTDILRERQYDALLSGELLGFDPDPYPFWHSSQVDYPGLNIALYANRKADTLIEEGRSATDDAVRTEKYLAFQTMLFEDLPAILLYQPTYAYAISNKIKGVDVPTILAPSDRFANIEDWYVKTKRVLQ